MKLKPTLVMPAIYRFETPNNPEASKWGWHRATELLTAVQQILLDKGCWMPAKEICRKYSHAFYRATKGKNILSSSYQNRTWAEEYGYPYVDKKGKLCNIVMQSSAKGGIEFALREQSASWLQDHADRDDYIPAKIGTALIDAIKHPVLSAVRTARVE